jgi:hypothetical protein
MLDAHRASDDDTHLVAAFRFFPRSDEPGGAFQKPKMGSKGLAEGKIECSFPFNNVPRGGRGEQMLVYNL